jgi:hypothetical protein
MESGEDYTDSTKQYVLCGNNYQMLLTLQK